MAIQRKIMAFGLVLISIFTAGRSFAQDKSIDRAAICKLDLPVYEDLIPNKLLSESQLSLLVQKKYAIYGKRRVDFPPKQAWFRSEDQHRSTNYDYHAWTILSPLLATLDEPYVTASSADAMRRLIIETAREWFDQFPDFKPHKVGEHFAWYDMAVGLRANALPYILKMGACSNSISNEEFASWWKISVKHAEALSLDSFHKGHNNHGLYQALGHYTFCKNLGMIGRCQDDIVLAETRVRDYLKRFFSKDGVHKEHSPSYQLYMLKALNQFVSHPDLSVIVTSEFVDSVVQSFDYFILPNNQMAQLGDTDARTYKVSLSRPDNSELTVFSDAGYGVVRDKDSHLIVSAAFHSRTHKHVDDGSFVWFDRGIPLIVDSGRYGYSRIKISKEERKALRKEGYWYSDPKRIYVESAHAHSTVEIDNKSDNRSKAEFYGSGLEKGVALENGAFYFYLEMPRMSGSVKQQRVFVYQPGEWLLVVDKMTPKDKHIHDYTSWLQLGSAGELLMATNQSALVQFGQDRLNITSLSPDTELLTAKGETEPRLLGWRAPRNKLIPAWSIGVKKSGKGDVVIANLLSLNSHPTPVQPGSQLVKHQVDGRIDLSWLINNKAVDIKLCQDWTQAPGQCQ